MSDSLYVVFERLPQRWGNRLPEPKNPVWTIDVYKVVGETEKRLILEPVGGETRSLPRDAQGRKYFARDEYLQLRDHNRAWHSSDLAAVSAYCGEVAVAWAQVCATRDAVARPLFAEIARLQGLIREADAVLDQAVPRIRDATSAHVPKTTASNQLSAA